MARKECLEILVEFSGGLELLFAGKRKHVISIPMIDSQGRRSTIMTLLDHLRDGLASGAKQDMFILDDDVRPGILVLINDSDWDLEGGSAYVLQEGDQILFVSTLHGG